MVEVEREVFKHVPKVQTKVVEKEIEVIGDVIEVPRPFLIENRVVVPRFVDNPVPTVVSQTLTPTFVESGEHVVEVRLREYEAEAIAVDIFLPRPIDRNIAITGGITRTHTPVEIPLAHYNSLVLKLNSSTSEASKLAIKERRRVSTSSRRSASTGLSLTGQFVGSDESTTDDEIIDPSLWIDHFLIPTAAGAVPLLHNDVDIVTPTSDDWMEEYDEKKDYIIQTNDMSTGAGCSRCRWNKVGAKQPSVNRLSSRGQRQKSEGIEK